MLRVTVIALLAFVAETQLAKLGNRKVLPGFHRTRQSSKSFSYPQGAREPSLSASELEGQQQQSSQSSPIQRRSLISATAAAFGLPSFMPAAKASFLMAEGPEALAVGPESPYPIKAITTISGPSGVSGVVYFKQLDDEKCMVAYEIEGLTPGKYGIRVHEKSDFTDGCASMGATYNPVKLKGGAPAIRPLGDLGNIIAGDNGVAQGAFMDMMVKLEGSYNVVGRSIVLSDNLVKGDISERGNAGARMACGEIKISSTMSAPVALASSDKLAEFLTPGVFLMASCLLVLTGLQTYGSFQRPMPRRQKPLMQV